MMPPALLVFSLLSPVPAGQAPTPEALLAEVEERGLAPADMPFEVAASIAKLYWGKDRTEASVPYLEAAVGKAAPLTARYAALLKKPQKAPPACSAVPKALADAEAQLKSWSPPEALGCLREVLRPAVEAQVALGDAHHLAGRTEQALAAYAAALAVSADEEEALFGEAVLLLESKGDSAASVKRAKVDLQRLVDRHPDSPRAARARALLQRAAAAK